MVKKYGLAEVKPYPLEREYALMKQAAQSWKRWLAPIVLMAAATAALAIGMSSPDGTISPQKVYSKIGFPLLRLLAFLAAGLLVGQMLESFGWTRRLGRWVQPVTRWAHLTNESGAAFLSSFVSGIVANTVLMQSYTAKSLTRKELVLTYLLNSGLPQALAHLPTNFFIVASLAGKAGIAYVGINLAASFFRSICVLVYCRRALPMRAGSSPFLAQESPSSRSAAVRHTVRKFLDRFTRLALYTFPVYVLVFLANERGFFLWIRTAAGGWISGEIFPVEAAGVVMATMAAEFSAGMAAAGALVETGALTVKQTVLALILGTIVATPIRAVRHQLPTHAGIFSLGLGSELLMLSQAARIVSLILVTVPYLLFA